MSNAGNKNRSPMAAVVVLLLLVAIGGVYLATKFLGGPSIQSLQQTALNGATSEAQVQAAQQLAQLGEDAVDALRVVSAQSTNPDVVSVIILAISRLRDYKSIDVLIAKLDDNVVRVRSSAAKALEKMLGRDYHFPVDGSDSERANIRDQIIEDWNSYNGSELFEHNKKRFKIIN